MSLHALFWLIHLVGLITWLGPTTAAWLLVRRAWRAGDDRLALWVRREAKVLYRLEHIGLLLLVIGGLGLLHAAHLNPVREVWLGVKLLLFVGVVLPVEIVNFRHRARVHRALRRAAGAMTDDLRAAMAIEDRSITRAFWVVALAIIAIFLLAIFRPTLGG